MMSLDFHIDQILSNLKLQRTYLLIKIPHGIQLTNYYILDNVIAHTPRRYIKHVYNIHNEGKKHRVINTA